MKQKADLLGVSIDKLSFSEAASFAEQALLRKTQIKIFTPNPEIILKACKDPSFLNVLNSGDLLIPDGTGIILFSKIKETVTGVDLMLKICELAEKNAKSVFLLGGHNTAEKTAKKLKEMFPQLKVVGFSEDLSSCYNLIEISEPNIVFVALGAPKQERWITENIKKFPSINIAMGVGGAFDMISEKIKRAPKRIRDIHLEWLWRLIQEPRRARRIFNAVFVFPIYVLKEKTRFKK